MPHPDAVGLDQARLQRVAEAYAGYARVLANSARPELAPWEASSLLLAASYGALFQPLQAARDFEVAAARYAEMDAPFAVVLAICAGNDQMVQELAVNAVVENIRDAGPLQRLGIALGRRWLQKIDGLPADIEMEGEDRAAVRYAFAPSGRLGIPVARYEEAFNEVQALAGDMRMRPRASGFSTRDDIQGDLPRFASLLERAGEITLHCIADGFHWMRVQSAILPAEPEMIAACRCVLRIWRDHGRLRSDLFGILAARGIDPVAAYPLEVAADLDGDDGPWRGSSGSPRGRNVPGPGAGAPYQQRNQTLQQGGWG